MQHKHVIPETVSGSYEGRNQVITESINRQYLPDIAKIVFAIASTFGLEEYVWGDRTLAIIDLMLALWLAFLILNGRALESSRFRGELVLIPGLAILVASTYFSPDPGYLWSFIGASCIFLLSSGLLSIGIAVVFTCVTVIMVSAAVDGGHALRVGVIMSAILAVSYFVSSRLKALFIDLEQQRYALEQAQEVQSQFIDDVSHEMRTPLTAIHGFAEVLAAKGAGNRNAPDLVKQILVNTRVLNFQINDLIDSSSLRSGQLSIKNEETSIEKLIDSILADIETIKEDLYPDRAVTIRKNIDRSMPMSLMLDSNHTVGILMRLMINALKNTERGEIELKANYKLRAQRVIFTVIDTGQGIPADISDSLFGIFSQAAKSQEHVLKGLGLGLHVSRNIARKLGGDITYAPGKPGNLFTLSLPALQVPPTASRPMGTECVMTAREGSATVAYAMPQSRQTRPKRGPLHILLADDSETNRLLISMLLEDLGHVCAQVSDGREALETFDPLLHDLILMDIQMPVMSGIEATSQLRSQGIDVPIIAVSAGTSLNDAAVGHTRLFTDFISKPIDFKKLRLVLERQWASSG